MEIKINLREDETVHVSRHPDGIVLLVDDHGTIASVMITTRQAFLIADALEQATDPN